MSQLTFMLGRVVEGIFHLIKPTYSDSEMIFDGAMEIMGVAPDTVKTVMGNTQIFVRLCDDHISIIARGSTMCYFDNARQTSSVPSPSDKLHELRLERDSHQLSLHYYVIRTGDTPPCSIALQE